MEIKKVNIGLAIEQQLNALNISKSEFGRKIGVMQQNVNRILDKSSIDTDKLIKISEALNYNFFQEYVPADDQAKQADNEPTAKMTSSPIQPSISDSDKKFYQEQIKFLTEQVKELSERNHELEDELRNIHREKKADVG